NSRRLLLSPGARSLDHFRLLPIHVARLCPHVCRNSSNTSLSSFRQSPYVHIPHSQIPHSGKNGNRLGSAQPQFPATSGNLPYLGGPDTGKNGNGLASGNRDPRQQRQPQQLGHGKAERGHQKRTKRPPLPCSLPVWPSVHCSRCPRTSGHTATCAAHASSR